MEFSKHCPAAPTYKGPKNGFFTLIHHQGPLVEYSKNIYERLAFIDTDKASHERLIRKAHILHVPMEMIPTNVVKAYAAWDEAVAPWAETYTYAAWVKAYAAWVKVIAPWDEADTKKLTAYIKDNVTDYRWNGVELDNPRNMNKKTNRTPK